MHADPRVASRERWGNREMNVIARKTLFRDVHFTIPPSLLAALAAGARRAPATPRSRHANDLSVLPIATFAIFA